MKKVIIGGSIMIVTIFLVVTYTLFSYFGITQAKIAKLDITITTESLEKYYDETPLTSAVWEMASGTLFEGDTIQVVMDSTITEAGSIKNQAHVTIVDEKNRAVTHNYNITYKLGSLTIKPIELTITTVSASKTYDAKALSKEGFELYKGQLFENHRMITVMESTITDAGQIPNDIGVTILNAANNNVTHNYEITYDLGYLTVYPKQISIRTGQASKIYDGLSLSNNTWQLTGGTLLQNHELSIEMPAVIVEAGQIVNQPVITIIDSNQNDVVKNYEIIEDYGLLTIYARNLTIKTSSLEKEYDGTVLKGGDWVITSGSLANKHTIEADMPISIVNAGFAYNEISLVIKDAKNIVVTNNYEITYDLGSLLITPIYILINTGSAEKLYDGLPLINQEWLISKGNLLPKHTISVDISASITYPGSIINNAIITIYDAYGINMNNNYYIDEGFGSLTIHPFRLIIKTESDIKPYDGLPLSNDSWTILSGSLLSNHRINQTMNTSIITPGSVENLIDLVIVDENNTDVTSLYQIEYDLGTLTVIPVPLTITTETKTKQYDGTPLTSDIWMISSGVLLENHWITTIMNSTITLPGKIGNEIAVNILDEEGRSVLSFYEISYNIGELTVLPVDIIISTETKFKEYDGLPLTSNVWNLTGGTLFNGHYISATMNSSITEPGYVENRVNVRVLDQNNNDVTHFYNINTNLGNLAVLPRNIIINTESMSQNYTGDPLRYPYFNIIFGSLVDGHYIVESMPSSITLPGKINNAITVTVYDINNNDVTYYYDFDYNLGELTVLPVDIIIATETKFKEYDGLPLTSNVWDLIGGTLFDGHYIVESMPSSITLPGKINNAITVTVYDRNNNDVTYYYDFDYNLGELTVLPVDIIIATETKFKEYDGLPLTSNVWDLIGGTLFDGHYIVESMPSSITLPGEINNAITVTVYDRDNNDVTYYYNFQYNLGELTVLPVDIIIATESKSKEYDGLPLTSNVWDLIGGTLFDGHYIVESMPSSITLPGEINNAITVTVYDRDNNDVTYYYNFQYNLGELTVLPVDIIIATESKSKEYDGLPLTSTVWNLTGGTLFEGHYISAMMIASITEPGYVENRVNVRVLDQNNNDFTHFYNIDTNLGNLTVLPKNIIITTESMSRDYTGDPLRYPYYNLISGSLLDGHYIVETMPSSITLPGEINNAITVTVYDRDNNDVTYYYNFNYILGILKVNPIPLILQSGSANKLYDGTPLEYDYYKIVSGNVLPGHNLIVTVEGSITEVGTIDNLIHAYVEDNEGNYVSGYYLFDYALGRLTVLENMYDSSELARDALEPDKTDHLKIYSTKTETIYLRQESKGDYLFYGWGIPVVQDLGITVNPMRFTSMALSRLTTINSVQIEHLRDRIKYVTPYYIDDVINHTNDVFLSGDTSVIYKHNYLSYDFFSDYGSILIPNPSLTTQEQLYRNFVYDNYLTVPDSTRQSMLQIASNNGLSSSSPTIIKDVKDYIQKAATYGDIDVPDDVTDIAVYFLTTAKQGICQHFATAATLMYRSLGVPARYVEGYLANAKAYSWVTITGESAHAWVEVYVDGIGWIPVEVTASTNQEVLGKITVTPSKVAEMYEVGKTIVATQVKLTNFKDFEALGYTYTFTLSGSQSNPGIGTSEVSQFNIFDPEGNDVTNQFDITYKTGPLQLYLREITLMTYGATKAYDGTALIKHDYALIGELEPNHYVSKVTYRGSQILVGVSNNIASITILDELGNDVTGYYLIKNSYGKLTVTPRSITIESNSATKRYDGTELTAEGYQITKGSLLEGDTVEIIVTGSQQSIGRSDNIIESVRIMRGDIDVSAYYEIDTIEGLLTVTPY